jgi:hypothetical protein
MRYYINLIKLRLRFASKMQVVRGCGGILGCGVAGAATQNR